MVSQTPDRTIFTGSRVPPAWASVTTPGGCPSQRPAGFSRGAVSTFEGERKHSRKRPSGWRCSSRKATSSSTLGVSPTLSGDPCPLHPGPSESPARLAPFSSESPACPGVGRPRSPGDGRGQPGELRPQSGPGVAEGGELRHLIPEPWGGGGLPGQAGAVRPHPPADSRHLSGMKLDITHRPRSHDGALLAPPTPFPLTAQQRMGGRIRVGSSRSTPSAVRAWQRTGWRKDRAERGARSSCWSARRPS